jgi:lysophospholipase L1-like esterase
MAFGDSITFGVIPTACSDGSVGTMTSAQIMRDLQTIWPRATPPPSTAYPNVLRTLLAGRYVTQSPVVVNEGLPGERVTDDFWGTNDVTKNRLTAALSTDAPQVLLLQEGVNDLNSNNLHPEVVIPAVIKALHDMIREAKLRGVGVLLGTLLPQQAGGCRAYAPSLIAPTNEQIRALAVSDGVVLVDLNQAFGAVPGQYMSFDGLHPNALGYDKMAQTFFDSIRTTFEK